MGNIVLPNRLREPFEGLSGAILRAFPVAVVAMGGGSMLEALWHHRVSTDLDLFISPDNLEKANRASRWGLYSELLAALQAAEVGVDDVPRTQQQDRIFLTGQCSDGTPWSLSDMAYMDPKHPMLDSVEGSGIRTANLAEIFMGKIAGRFYNADTRSPESAKQRVPIRDCYDVCVCAAVAPTILQQIVDRLRPDALARISTNLLNAPHDLHMKDSRSIIDPKWEIDLEDVAPRIGEAFASRSIDSIPVAQKKKPKPSGYRPK